MKNIEVFSKRLHILGSPSCLFVTHRKRINDFNDRPNNNINNNK